MVDGIALDDYSADTTAKKTDSVGITAGKYRIKNDGKMIWIVLTNPHKATLNAKTGMDSDGKKTGKLTGTWSGLSKAKDLTVTGN